MIDYLLKFPSKDVAIQFGSATGLATQDESGIWKASIATHDHCLLEIGEHNESDYWILYRDFTGIPVPNGADQFIYWCSKWTILDNEGNKMSVPRPQLNPDVPDVFWA